MRLWQKRPWIPLEHQGGAQTTKLGYSARISNHKVSLGENMTSWIVSSSEKALAISSNHKAPQPRPVVHPSGGFLFTQREANHQFEVILSYFSTNFRWLLVRDHLLAHHLRRLLKHSSQNAKLVYNFESLSLDTRHGFGVIHFIVLASISMQQPHVFMASSQKASNSSPSSTSGGFFHLRWGNEWRLVNYNLGMITYWAQWKAS